MKALDLRPDLERLAVHLPQQPYVRECRRIIGVQTLTATIAAELGEAVQGDDHYRVLFVIGLLLFAIAFVVNLSADLVVRGIRGKQNV